METVKRNCMRALSQFCCRRRQLEDGCGSYNMLSNNSKTAASHKGRERKRSKVVPQGCFCVYVGAEKQRFVIKIELANHPLFKILLEVAANEYGLRNDGPICLPCDADFFCEALAEMMDSTAKGSVVQTPPLSHCSNWAHEILRIPRALMLKLNND